GAETRPARARAAAEADEVAGTAAKVAAGVGGGVAAAAAPIAAALVALDLPRVGHVHQVAQLLFGVAGLDEPARIGQRLALLLVVLHVGERLDDQPEVAGGVLEQQLVG